MYCHAHSKGLFSIKLSIESDKKTEVLFSSSTIRVSTEVSFGRQRVQCLPASQTEERNKDKLPFGRKVLYSVVRTYEDLVLALENNCSHFKIRCWEM